jgi:hypothetical protein
MRYKFIKDKYERHKFVDMENTNESVFHFIQNAQTMKREEVFELLLLFFGQNFNFMAPIENDVCFICLNFKKHKFIF